MARRLCTRTSITMQTRSEGRFETATNPPTERKPQELKGRAPMPERSGVNPSGLHGSIHYGAGPGFAAPVRSCFRSAGRP